MPTPSPAIFVPTKTGDPYSKLFKMNDISSAPDPKTGRAGLWAFVGERFSIFVEVPFCFWWVRALQGFERDSLACPTVRSH